MFEILKKLINQFSHPRNKNVVNSDELNFLYPIPFVLPKKRWPEFFFKIYNAKVTASHTIFRSFNHDTFFNANKQLISFQNKEFNFAPIDILKWIHIEQQEVFNLRTSLEDFQNSNRIKSLDSFLASVNNYIQSLENTLLSQRSHPKTSLYLNDAVRSLLQKSEGTLTNIFNFLDDSSMKDVPKKIELCHENLLLVDKEIENFPEYRAWHSKISSTVEALENIIHGNTNITYSDLKKILRPWFSGFGEGQLFLEQCIRQLLTHYVIPNIQTISDKRLTLIREFHPYWAEAICDRLMKENKVHQDSKTPSHSRLTKNSKIETSCVSKFCFWRKDKNVHLKNNQLEILTSDNNQFENTTAILQ